MRTDKRSRILHRLMAFIALSSISLPTFGFLPVRRARLPLSTPATKTPVALHGWLPDSQLLPADTQLLTDLAVAGSLGFAADPLVEALFNVTHLSQRGVDTIKSTFLYGAAASISLSARLFGFLCLVDAALEALHLQIPGALDLREGALKVSLTVWAALTFSTIKRTILKQAVSGTELGRAKLYDRLIDFVVLIVLLTGILDELDIDIGMGLQSLFAAGGIGAVVFSLASKSLAEEIVGGFAISAWDAFEEGDAVRLGDGTEGTVYKIGLIETEICGYDDIIIRIPNSQLLRTRVSNLSRIESSRVQQILRFKLSDIEKVPKILSDITDEIRSSCPELISDGSKPFRAVLSNYEPDHIQTTVVCHFSIPPGSAKAVKNREHVLLAIARAMKKNDAEFAIPAINYLTDD